MGDFMMITDTKCPPYDEGEDWEEYISHSEICAELGKWRETAKVLALAAALGRGGGQQGRFTLAYDKGRSPTMQLYYKD